MTLDELITEFEWSIQQDISECEVTELTADMIIALRVLKIQKETLEEMEKTA